MLDTEKREVLRTILNDVCAHIDQYQTAARAHVAAQILAAAGRDITLDEIRQVGREALKNAPTMWR